MAFKITTLMENISPRDCLASEHGLSLLIEGTDCKVLYDTGASPRFLKNAKALQADLGELDALVLSHGHYDHTGGVSALLDRRDRPKTIYFGPNLFEERYSQKRDGLMEIGAAMEEDFALKADVPWVVVGEEPIALGKGLWLVSGFTATEEMEQPSPRMLRRINGQMVTDRFEDEVAVVLELQEGLALISGCSHVGIVSMCRRVSRLFDRPVKVFVGGTHLMAANEERIQKTCELLREMGLGQLGACHCNGEQAGAYFEEHFPGFFRNNVGTCLELE